MGNTKDELINWMLEVAEARLRGEENNRAKTVNMKFSRLTLEMWVDRVKELQDKSLCQNDNEIFSNS